MIWVRCCSEIASPILTTPDATLSSELSTTDIEFNSMLPQKNFTADHHDAAAPYH
jgi:hypothetical protein